MSKFKRTSASLLSVLFIAAVVEAKPPIEKPVVLPDAVLSVTVSDFHGFVDGVGLIAAKVNPQINGMMLKMLVGMQVGDPGLTGIAPGKGLSIVAQSTTNIFAVMEVSEPQAPVYANLATSRGMQSVYTNGVMIVAPTVEQVAEGIQQSEDVKNMLESNRSPALRITSRPTDVIENNSDLIQGYMESFPAMMQATMLADPGAETNAVATTAKILEGELSVLLSLSKQCETLEIKLSPVDGALQISETFVPLAGSALAKLVDSPKTADADGRIQAGLLGDGLIMSDLMFGNSEAFADFMGAEIDKLAIALDLADVDVKPVVELSKKWLSVYSGAASETVSLDPDTGIENGVLIETADENAMLELFKTMSSDMTSLLKFYEALGIPMTIEFKENIREYKGISVHQFHVGMDLKDMPAAQQEQLKELKVDDMTYEVAIFDGLTLYYLGEQKIEDLIDRVKNEELAVEPLKARSIYPAGGFYYVDFDTAQYLELIASVLPENELGPVMPQLIALMQGADPVTAAGFRDNGVVMCSINLPGDMLAKLGQIGMMMQMQQKQQAAPGMAPAPVQ